MKTTLSTNEVTHALLQDDNAAWSYEGAKAFAEYLDDMEVQMEEEMELDVVALRCDFSEHESAVDCIDDLGYGFESELDPSDWEEMCEHLKADYEAHVKEEEALEYLSENTQVITFEGGIIIQGF